MILGITGGTGCGKTTLLNVLKERGAVVLDCDAIYHELLTRDASLLAAIEERFPGTVEDGVLQRKKLGNLVFSDKNALLDLNRITHAAVKREVLRRLGEKPALAAIDAIALFEGGLAELCDVTVAVTAPVEDRVRRELVPGKMRLCVGKHRVSVGISGKMPCVFAGNWYNGFSERAPQVPAMHRPPDGNAGNIYLRCRLLPVRREVASQPAQGAGHLGDPGRPHRAGRNAHAGCPTGAV